MRLKEKGARLKEKKMFSFFIALHLFLAFNLYPWTFILT
jgi:hypothetical protein